VPGADLDRGGVHPLNQAIPIADGIGLRGFVLRGLSYAEGTSTDVGVDCWNWRPVTLGEVKNRPAQVKGALHADLRLAQK